MKIFGFGIPELEVVCIVLLVYVLPFALVLYVVRLLIDYLRLSIGEMESRAKVRREKEPEVKEMRAAVALSLAELREARGMTQEYVAEQLGVSRQAVSKWENGATDPSTTNLIALARLYEVDPGEVLRGIAERKGA